MVIEKRQYKDFTYYVLRKRGATPFYIRRVSHLNPVYFLDGYPLNYIVGYYHKSRLQTRDNKNASTK